MRIVYLPQVGRLKPQERECTSNGTETAHCGSERATIDIIDDVPSCDGASSGGSSGSGGGAMPGTGDAGG